MTSGDGASCLDAWLSMDIEARANQKRALWSGDACENDAPWARTFYHLPDSCGEGVGPCDGAPRPHVILRPGVPDPRCWAWDPFRDGAELGLDCVLPGDDLPTDTDVIKDAERWRKLVACQRIRVLGYASLGKPNGHVGLELWGEYPPGHLSGADVLTAFVDGLAVPPASQPRLALPRYHCQEECGRSWSDERNRVDPDFRPTECPSCGAPWVDGL